MRLSSLVFFAVVLIIALQTLPISGKATKTTAAKTVSTTTTTTTTTPATTTKLLATIKKPTKVVKKVLRKKKKGKKSKKPKQSPWISPDANQKKLFNDYKTILRTKLNDRKQNVSATFPLEPVRYGSQTIENTILHHFLIKLPDSKYAHAIIGTHKDPKTPSPVKADSASIRRTIYDNLEAAQA